MRLSPESPWQIVLAMLRPFTLVLPTQNLIIIPTTRHCHQGFRHLPGVSAEFSILDDNHMVVDIPSSDGTGWIDIYALGEFGAGKLSMDSYREYMTIQPTTTYGLQLTGVEIPT